MRFLVALLASLLTFEAHAAVAAPEKPQHGHFILAAGVQGVLEQESVNTRTLLRVPWLVRAGVAVPHGDVAIEYSQFHVESGEGSITVARSQRMLMAWYRRAVGGSENILPYIAAGLGAQEQTVITDVGSLRARISGTPYLLGGVATGATWMLNEGDSWETSGGLEVSGEFRVLASETFRPNPTIGASVFVGYRF